MPIIEHELPDLGTAVLNIDETAANLLIAKGFRFAIYDKKRSRFELEPPYEIGRAWRRPFWIVRQVL